MKCAVRRKIIMPLLLALCGPAAMHIGGYKRKKYRPRNKVFILAANHSDAMDPIYEMLTLGRYICFISADHVINRNFFGKVVKYFGTPIVKRRDHPKEELIRDIKKTLASGYPVGIHAEGTRSYTGETGYILPNTAKLIKESGEALITFRSCCGFLRKPKWAKSKRRGPVYGYVVQEYDAGEIAGMSETEVYELLCRDLYVNVYNEQRKNHYLYKGENLAESCELVLYRCPKCGKYGTLKSKNDRFFCKCGYSVKYGEDGFFHQDSGELIYDNFADWERWQRETLPEYIETFKDKPDWPIFTDEGQSVYRVTNDRREPIGSAAKIALYYDRIEIEEFSAKLSDIKRLSYADHADLMLVTDNDYLVLRSETPRSSSKYMDAWRLLTGRTVEN